VISFRDRSSTTTARKLLARHFGEQHIRTRPVRTDIRRSYQFSRGNRPEVANAMNTQMGRDLFEPSSGPLVGAAAATMRTRQPPSRAAPKAASSASAR
jgi:hypothetical protein